MNNNRYIIMLLNRRHNNVCNQMSYNDGNMGVSIG